MHQLSLITRPRNPSSIVTYSTVSLLYRCDKCVMIFTLSPLLPHHTATCHVSQPMLCSHGISLHTSTICSLTTAVISVKNYFHLHLTCSTTCRLNMSAARCTLCETCSTMFESKENLDTHIFFSHTIFIYIDLVQPQQHPFYNPNLRRWNPVRYLVHIVGRLPMTLV